MLTDAALLFSARSNLEGLREGGLVGEDEAALMMRALDGYSGERREGGDAAAALAVAAAEVTEVKRALVSEVKEFKAHMAKEMKEIKMLLMRNTCSIQVLKPASLSLLEGWGFNSEAHVCNPSLLDCTLPHAARSDTLAEQASSVCPSWPESCRAIPHHQTGKYKSAAMSSSFLPGPNQPPSPCPCLNIFFKSCHKRERQKPFAHRSVLTTIPCAICLPPLLPFCCHRAAPTIPMPMPMPMPETRGFSRPPGR